MAGLTDLAVPFAGTVLRVDVAAGDRVPAGAVLVVLESMKMEHVVEAATPGVIDSVLVAPGDAVQTGDVIVRMTESDGPPVAPIEADTEGRGEIRPELTELRARVAATLDAGRPAATERRHAGGRRTARENVEDLCDPGSFEEYGRLVIAAQRARRSTEDLIANTPADGLIAGIGRVNGDIFDSERSRCAVLSYDYSVLAGTQGQMNHRKKDRLFELVERLRLPVVLFAEGGGGRPGDTDMAVVTGLDTEAFALFGALSGLVPLVGVVSGRCFAGNAALLGCCHVIIATPDANVGMGGPAMIEGGGLGVFAPEDVGPVTVQVPNGVVDVLCADEKEAVEVARRYLSYFQGDRRDWSGADQDLLREVVPPDRRRVYDVPAGGRAPGRRGVGARAAAVVRPRHGDGARAHGGPAGRGDRQQPDAPGGRHRRRVRRQGGPLHAAVRGLRPAAAVPVRHARVHGRARGGGDGAGAPRQPDVRRRRVAHGALLPA